MEPVSVTTLPNGVRAFGFVPAIEQLLPGDLLLFRPVAGTMTSRGIAGAQRRAGFAADHAAWTHAAIFLYDDVMVEALPVRGVVQSSLYSRLPGHCILVRRRPELDESIRYRVALWALGRIGKRYSHLAVVGLGWDMLKGLWSDSSLASNRQVVICSQVFADAQGEMAGKRLAGCPYSGATTPAHLSATPDLVDVAIGWKKLV
ncbi:MAG: hypothetical protein K2Z25_09040 [Beijerinckiaceae bacterium]|nr:hypothetical protein [Beijerinckiaceae bacterium]